MSTSLNLDKRLKIRLWQDVPDGGFSVEQTFDAGRDAWGAIKPAKGAIFYGAKQIGNDVTDVITVRMSSSVKESTVTPDHVIDHPSANRRYRVKRSTNRDGQGLFLDIECELLGEIPDA